MREIEVRAAEEQQKKIDLEIVALNGKFTAITITSEADFERVDNDVKMVKKLKKDAETIFEQTIDGYYKPYKFWLGVKKGITDRLTEFENIGKKAQIAFMEAKRIEREKAEAAAAEEARIKEEKQREKLEKKAEVAAASGDTGKAEALLDQAAAVHVVARPVDVVVPSAKGTSLRYRWTGECVDLMKLVKAVAEGRAPLGLLMANAPAINAQARASQDTFPIDGIKFNKVAELASSTR